LASLLPIGRDARTGGYVRYAWMPADSQCRAWFRRQAAARGLDVEMDRNGNLWAWSGPPELDADAVVTGSHLDSVPYGGAYDGPLGIVSAFAALDLLRQRKAELSRPVGVVAFTDEEGARFGVPCVGSRLLTGVLDPHRARELRDADGITLAEAMRAAGADPELLGPDTARVSSISAFVELHIEQGRGLVHTGSPVGVGTGIWPHGRWRFDFRGVADHAGTTRLADRRDPMLTMANTVLTARKKARRSRALATVGKVRVEPNGTNAIPSLVQGWLDARAADEPTLRALVDDICAAIRQRADRDGVAVTVTEESYTRAVEFNAGLRDRVTAILGGVPLLPTGAGHDAGILAAAGVPVAMLFVRNPTGVSHSPVEHADVADCLAGVEALAAVIADLAR
jgi:beta-ureidopropionase / N-carbamoyl-L-amino-acid hydrolase